MSTDELQELRRTVMELRDTTTELRTLSKSEGLRCPYRETISKAADNTDRLEAIEDRVTNLRIDVARIAAIAGVGGGLGFGLVGSIIDVIRNALGG
jgi:hypothetical protein